MMSQHHHHNNEEKYGRDPTTKIPTISQIPQDGFSTGMGVSHRLRRHEFSGRFPSGTGGINPGFCRSDKEIQPEFEFTRKIQQVHSRCAALTSLCAKFPQKVQAYAKRHGFLKAGNRVGVAVSGGADSVALLRLLLDLRKEMGLVLSVVHFNHKLRGADSEADEDFVADLSRSSRSNFIAKVVMLQ